MASDILIKHSNVKALEHHVRHSTLSVEIVVHGVNAVSPLVNLSALMAFTAFAHIFAQCSAEVGVSMYWWEPVTSLCPSNLVSLRSQVRLPEVMGVPSNDPQP